MKIEWDGPIAKQISHTQKCLIWEPLFVVVYFRPGKPKQTLLPSYPSEKKPVQRNEEAIINFVCCFIWITNTLEPKKWIWEPLWNWCSCDGPHTFFTISRFLPYLGSRAFGIPNLAFFVLWQNQGQCNTHILQCGCSSSNGKVLFE